MERWQARENNGDARSTGVMTSHAGRHRPAFKSGCRGACRRHPCRSVLCRVASDRPSLPRGWADGRAGLVLLHLELTRARDQGIYSLWHGHAAGARAYEAAACCHPPAHHPPALLVGTGLALWYSAHCYNYLFPCRLSKFGKIHRGTHCRGMVWTRAQVEGLKLQFRRRARGESPKIDEREGQTYV